MTWDDFRYMSDRNKLNHVVDRIQEIIRDTQINDKPRDASLDLIYDLLNDVERSNYGVRKQA